MPSVVLHPDSAPYDDRDWAYDGNPSALAPNIVGGGDLSDSSDSSYIETEHTTTNASAGAVTFEVWDDAPASYSVTHFIVRYRLSMTTDSEGTFYFGSGLTDINSTYDDPGKYFPDAYIETTPPGVWDFSGDPYDLESDNDDDAVAWNANGTNLQDVGDMAEAGMVLHFDTRSVAGSTSSTLLYELEVEIFYTEGGGGGGALSTIDSERGGVVFIPMPAGDYTVSATTVNAQGTRSDSTTGIDVTVT